jgi:predicted HTH transcriptional regulator
MNNELQDLLQTLRALPSETEWVEFKHNNDDPEEIGAYLSAISNSARLCGQAEGYLVWGIEDGSHQAVGTTFRPRRQKVNGQEMEHFLTLHLAPRLHFHICEFELDGLPIVIFKVPPCLHTPVRWRDTEYIRVGSYKKKLRDYPEKERALWGQLAQIPFESAIAAPNLSAQEAIQLLDYPAYFQLIGQPLPDNRRAILERLTREKVLRERGGNRFDITNLGAILFARRLSDFETLARKAVRVIIYKGNNRVETIKEWEGTDAQRGYAAGFESLILYVNDQLPRNEHIGPALRHEVRMYPEIAIRELIANALIHQDFWQTGGSPTVEIFADRLEITNPGLPLIDTLRFLDEPPQSRNEALASLMRRLHICEERGSGIDKTVFQCEFFQLPAPDFRITQHHTQAVLFAPRELSQMDSKDKIRACYQHACLRYVSHDPMSNASLRQRLGIKEKNYSIASRIIADTIKADFIKPYDPDNISKKHARYVPFWV